MVIIYMPLGDGFALGQQVVAMLALISRISEQIVDWKGIVEWMRIFFDGLTGRQVGYGIEEGFVIFGLQLVCVA